MQSLASLMSVKASDVGNLDDFVESDEEAEGRSRGVQPGVPTACSELGLAKTLGCWEGPTMFPWELRASLQLWVGQMCSPEACRHLLHPGPLVCIPDGLLPLLWVP